MTFGPFIDRLFLLVALASVPQIAYAQPVAPAEARAIAREAYTYGFPLVDAYRIMHAYFVDAENPEYKAPFNTLRNIPRVYTPEDKAVQAPNSDTPYSMLGMDLRAEPMVLTVPAVPKDRYYSIQLVDAYTFNFAYLGSRTTGNEAGAYLVAGPGWNGQPPPGVKRVFRSETGLVLAVYRTQLFSPSDLDNVKQVQAGYRAQSLSTFLGRKPAAPAASINFIRPLSVADQKTSPAFFDVLNFVLQFCPTHPSERVLMTRFAAIGIGAGKTFGAAALSPELRKAVADGMADAWTDLERLQATSVATGKVTSGDLFGTREYLENNYLFRFAGAVLGIFGNSKQEAMYPVYQVDAAGEKLDASRHRYALRFGPGQLPPVNAFWSLTMYELPSTLLVANRLNRYLINSPMLPGLRRDPDGGLTIYLQRESPGADRESNWLPAPNGPFTAILRLYWPKDEAADGRWKYPPVQKVK